jgi:[ribosomal protein S5]-alanine N-acetyltransferase
MAQILTLTTNRLILRPFTLQDAPAVKDLAGEREIAATTANIPHPYQDGMAEEWINTHQEAFDKGESVTFAIVRNADKQLVGAIGVHIYTINQLADMGYWIGKP